MKIMNAKQMMETARKKGYALPAINANGVTYDLARAILEAADELRSPMIIQEYEPNLEYRGYDGFTPLIKHLAGDLDIPICISLDHGKSVESVMRAVRAGFTHVMYDHASHPIEENIKNTNLVIDLVRPLGISVEAEIGNIFISKDEKVRAPVTSIEDIQKFMKGCDVDFLAVGVGTTHGIFKVQDNINFEHIKAIKKVCGLPIVLHGTSGVSMDDISRCVKAGMEKINFGEGIRMNYIQYFNELSTTLDHEYHVWRIMRAVKDKIKEDVKEIIRAVGSDGKL
ncbi:MAG: class II fructose-bisphosphate aldolase [Treponema sp.]|nr:class II fructose-bisphosphate aldolase [Treponema sp.]